MISIQNLSKHFSTKKNIVTALSNINLDIRSGEIFAIIGSSGAGKSTLLRCINLLEQPSQGHVIINGVDLMTLDKKQLRAQRKKIAMIFQHFNLINNKTVFDNVALPLKLNGELDEKRHKVKELLALVELSDKENAYPNQLSGGQKQRVAIARALISEPNLLLCDEATSALDPQTTKEIISLLKKINQKLALTIVLITHEMDLVRHLCHRFAIIDKGKITDVSSLEALFKEHPSNHPLIEGLTPTLPSCITDVLSKTPLKDHYPVCQVMFYGEASQKAIISQLSQQHSLQLNILQANIDTIGTHSFGILILQINGSDEQIRSAFDAFSQHQLRMEILGYVK